MTQKSKVIVYGTGMWALKRYNFLRLNYDITAFCDRSLTNAPVIKAVFNRATILPEELSGYEYDYLLIASTFSDQIQETLEQKYGVKRHKIRCGVNEYSKWENQSYHTFGNKNEDKTFFVISRGPGSDLPGLLAWFQDVLYLTRYAFCNHYIPVVDLKNYYNVYIDKTQIGKVNGWEQYFSQPQTEYTLEEAYESKYVVFAGVPYPPLRQPDYFPADSVLDFQARKVYKQLFQQYFSINSDILSQCLEQKRKLFGENQSVLGVAVRGTDYVRLKPFNHPVQPGLSEVIDKVHEYMDKYPIDLIYICTEERAAIDQFQKEFPDKVRYLDRKFYDAYNSDSDQKLIVKIDFHRERDAYLRGLEYLLSALLLTCCDYFISGICGATVGALLMGPAFREEYFFNKGVYGVDDDSYLFTPTGSPVYLREK